MEQSRNHQGSGFSVLNLIIILLGWVLFAPTKIGGSTSYIILVGNSMEPEFNRGDLVLVKKGSDYQLGDIVAYQQPDLNTVFHRIVKINDETFTLSGDHNVWNDSFQPTNDEIIGKLWIHIPDAGVFLQFLRTPIIFTTIVVVFALLIIFILTSNSQPGENTSRYDQNNKTGQNTKKDRIMEKQKSTDTLYLILAIAFISIILAISSFTAPLEDTVADNVEFTHNGSFKYYSFAPAGVYEGNILESGDPIYRQLNHSINIDFSYDLISDEPGEIYGGTFQMLARISEINGWNRTLVLIPPSFISGNSFTTSGVLDISDIEDLIKNLEEKTEIYNNRYTLSILPKVDIQGEINGRDFEDTFIPELSFSFDDDKMVLNQNNEDLDDILNPVQTSAALGTKKVANTISILGIKINVLIIRIISAYGLIGSIVALFWLNKIMMKQEQPEVEPDSQNPINDKEIKR